MRRKVAVVLIVLFWMGMSGLFFWREIYPALMAQPVNSFSRLRKYAQANPTTQMGIFTARGIRIGTTKTFFNIKEDNSYEISSDVTMRIPKTFTLSSIIEIGPDDKLIQFSIQLKGLLEDLAYMRGVMMQNKEGINELHLNYQFAGSPDQKIIELQEGESITGDMLSPMPLPGLHVGQTWKFKTIHPMTFAPLDGIAKVKKKTTIEIRGWKYSVFEVEYLLGANSQIMYVNSNGDVLKLDMPPFEMIREPLPHEIAKKKDKKKEGAAEKPAEPPSDIEEPITLPDLLREVNPDSYLPKPPAPPKVPDDPGYKETHPVETRPN